MLPLLSGRDAHTSRTRQPSAPKSIVVTQMYYNCEMRSVSHNHCAASRFTEAGYVRSRVANVVCEMFMQDMTSFIYVPGQDIFFCGVVPALVSGLLCASQILKRNLINDLLKLQKHIEEANSMPTARSFKAEL